MSRLRLLETSPAAGAIVMGTGIVSGGLALAGHEALSRVLLVLAAALWLALGLLLVWRVLSDRELVRDQARSPAALTGVAATAVLGTRLTLLGWHWAGATLLALAFALWLATLSPVLRNISTPTVGESLMLTVATESLAVLAAVLADRAGAPWLLYAAIAPLLLGLGLYVWVMARFDLRQLLVGRGDHWITGGALAISTLGAARIALAAKALGLLGPVQGGIQVAAVILWALAFGWLPVLVACEVLRPRLGYTTGRWSTVFPVGMYAACSLVAAAAVGSAALRDFARIWVWISLAVWLVVVGGLVRRAAALALSPACSSPR